MKRIVYHQDWYGTWPFRFKLTLTSATLTKRLIQTFNMPKEAAVLCVGALDAAIIAYCTKHDIVIRYMEDTEDD